MNTFQRKIKTFYAFRFFYNLHLFGAVLVPFFTEWASLTFTHALLLQAWFGFALLTLEIPTGVVADRWGRKPSMVLGSMVSIVAVIVYGIAPNIWLFILGEFLLAVSVALISGADEAWLYEWHQTHHKTKQLKTTIGRSFSFTLAGIFLSGILGSPIAEWLGLNAPMYLSAIPATLATICALQLPESKRKTKKIASSAIQSVQNSAKFLTSHPKLRPLTINLVLVSTSAYFVIWLYQPLLASIGVPVKYFGFFQASVVGSEIVISLLFKKLEEWFGNPERYLRFSAIAIALSFLLAAIQPTLVTVIIFLVIGGGLSLTRLEFAIDHFHKLAPPQDRAATRSALSMYRRMASTGANLLIGPLATASLPLAVGIIGILPIIAVVFVPVHSVFED